ncbi:MAG: DUF2794 domain-containing protein [Pseudomonadota bacterium]
MADVVSLDHYLKQAQRGSGRRQARPVYFDRSELQALMALYSEQVMAGTWRDYAIDHLAGMAAFSVYRRSQERPLYTLAKRQIGPSDHEYLLFEEGRRRRKAGDLSRLITWLRTPLKVVG